MPATVALISDQLRQAILVGELSPGERATQVSLANREFHRMLISGAADRVTALLDQLWDHASRYRRITL